MSTRATEPRRDADGDVASACSLDPALRMIAESAAALTGARLAVVRVLGPGEQLVARAIAGGSESAAAEVAGSAVSAADVGTAESVGMGALLGSLQRVASRLDTVGVLRVPVAPEGKLVASLELLRPGREFDGPERAVARLCAGQVALALRAFARDEGAGEPGRDALELMGEALIAGFAEDAGAEQIARLAAEAAGARGAILWHVDEEGPVAAARFGLSREVLPVAARILARHTLESRAAVWIGPGDPALPAGIVATAEIKLGHPPEGLLQLLFAAGEEPDDDRLGRLATFGARAAQALRAGSRARLQAQELERPQALLAIVGQAIARLSLAHTLATAVEQVTSLLAVDRAAVYLREGGRLVAAAGHGLTGPHVKVAERLLELALRSFRSHGFLALANIGRELGGESEAAVSEAGLESAVALPLIAHAEVIGLLALYPPRGRVLTEHESSLLGPLADQLAVAVQNARLHEQAKALGADLEAALAADRRAARRLQALYDVSRSFTQSLSVEATLEAVARTAVENLAVDAAVLRVPDERGESLVTQALHVADARLEKALGAMLSRGQVLSRPALQRLFRRGEPLHLDPAAATALGGSFALLAPFLEKGSTVVVVPVATPNEVLATLSLISLDPGRPIGAETVDTALTIAAQAALALENAHLYEQQKQFTDSLQRALLPQTLPVVAGLELGVVYESSSRMDVGGDVYDLLVLPDGRLAVLLGDVSGHGIDAAAEMAMAKFVFRSLVREHPEPGDFLRHANEVIAGELPVGKFITLLYVAVDPVRGDLGCASAGHPQPRLVAPDGSVRGVPTTGLALGIEAGERYEEARASLEPGCALVLYTDGVLEARREGELYGLERLDALLGRLAGLPAAELAAGVVADCRRFAGGELPDDCAVVVVRRTG